MKAFISYSHKDGWALERHENGDARVIPIIVEPCDWLSSHLRRLKALPRDGKPIAEWTNQNNAFLDIVTELRRLEPHNGSGPAAGAQAQRARAEQPRYRVRRTFDEIDRGDFRLRAFEIMRAYFEGAANEINGIEGLRARFTSFGSHSFGCTLVNRALARGTAHITVHARSGNLGLGDIFYSFTENAPADTANGSFNIEADEYDLHLKASPFGFGANEERVTPEQAADRLWTEFLGQAGVSHG